VTKIFAENHNITEWSSLATEAPPFSRWARFLSRSSDQRMTSYAIVIENLKPYRQLTS